MNMEVLIEKVREVMDNAYVPYSNYHVGAVLITKDDEVFTGCNVENHGIQSICAERVAFTKALSEGKREFKMILVAGGKDKNNLDHCLPCGYCRQFMSEFVSADFPIYVIENDKYTEYKLSDLLPHSFKL